VRARDHAVVAAAATALLLGGCSSPAPVPAGLSKHELQEAVQAELDRQWEFTGLDGTEARPPAAPVADPASGESDEGLSNCLVTSGFGSWGYGDDGLTEVNGSPPESGQLLAWYACNAAHPRIDFLSSAQRDYIYDYYTNWLVPCLGLDGKHMQRLPSRAEFHEPSRYTWSPYHELMDPPRTQKDQDRLEALCPATVPGVPGWSR
jgi:hypothetical protein